MSAELVQWLIEATLLSSVATTIVLALSPILNRLFDARAAIVLWLLVPLALIVTVVPERIVEAEAVRLGATPTAVLERLGNGLPMRSNPANGGGPHDLIALLWAAGGVAMMLLMVRSQRCLRLRLGALQPLGHRLYRSSSTRHGPLLIGALNPRIIVPRDFADRFGARQRRLMLAHEFTHLRRGDPFWNLVAAGLRCLFWFNPLLHWSATRFRRDQELACDAQVLALRSYAVRVYAEALLALGQPEPRLPALAFGAHPLKERIMKLSTLKSQSRFQRRFGLALSLLLAAAFACAAWALTPETQEQLPDEKDATTPDAGRFAFDVEISVNGQKQLGTLNLHGDVAVAPTHDGQPRMFARDRLVLEHRDDASGWSAEIDIERIDDDRFDVHALIEKQDETIATPRLIIGSDRPAWIESSDSETGEVAYRIKLIPVKPDR